MTREIKFRVWSKENEIMLDWEDLLDAPDFEEFMRFADKEDAHYSKMMQFTGLIDKNGVEIYEGDICSTDLSRPYNVVVFRNGAFMYQCNDHDEDYFDIMVPIDETTDQDRYTEVLGNIHTNPELLERESK